MLLRILAFEKSLNGCRGRIPAVVQELHNHPIAGRQRSEY